MKNHVKNLKSLLLIFCATIFASGCATDSRQSVKEEPPLNSAEQVHASTTIIADDFKKVVKVSGPWVKFNGTVDSSSLRPGFIKYSGKTLVLKGAYLFATGTTAKLAKDSPMLVVVWEGKEWAFLKEAVDDSGQTLEVSKVDSKVIVDGSYVEVGEIVAVHLPKTYLEKSRETGVRLRVYGQRGSVDVVVPAFYIQGFVAACDAGTK